jgi:hypothetical protein
LDDLLQSLEAIIKLWQRTLLSYSNAAFRCGHPVKAVGGSKMGSGILPISRE